MGIVRPGYGPQPLWWCRGAANSACALAAQRGVRYSAPAGSDGGKRHDRIGKKRSSISYGHCQLDQSIPPPVTVPAAPECPRGCAYWDEVPRRHLPGAASHSSELRQSQSVSRQRRLELNSQVVSSGRGPGLRRVRPMAYSGQMPHLTGRIQRRDGTPGADATSTAESTSFESCSQATAVGARVS
jgi:hypothetical protein